MATTNRCPVVGRLAPTPSGLLHLGNALAFAAAWLSVRSQGGRLLLRIEDIDSARSRPHFVDQLLSDLHWLGLTWDERVPNQSLRRYDAWLQKIEPYRCLCTRRQIKHNGHPKTCRTANSTTGSWRWALPNTEIEFVDGICGPQKHDLRAQIDPVMKRRDNIYAYALAVVVDDLIDGVTEVVRGRDLLDLTGAQIALWRALGATEPRYFHSPQVLGLDGRKLSKSFASASILQLREGGATPDQIWATVLPWLGLQGGGLEEVVSEFSWSKITQKEFSVSASEVGG